MSRAALSLVVGSGVTLAASCSVDDLPIGQTDPDDAAISAEAGDGASDGAGEVGDSSQPDTPLMTCDGALAQACYAGPAGTLGVGTCLAGLTACDGEGGVACEGQVLPATADCTLDELDTDCDDRTGAHVWSKRFGAGNLQRLQHLAVDASGNVFATGYAWGSIPLSSGLTLAPGSYLFKLDASGNVAWGKGWATGLGMGVTTLPNGDVVDVVHVSETTNFGGGPLIVNSSPQPIMVRYGADGTHLWSRLLPARIEAVRTKSATELIVGGTFWNTLDWSGAPSIQAQTSADVVIASVDAESGDAKWVKGLGGNANVARLALDSQKNILVVGRLTGIANLGGGDLGDGNVLSYVAKLDAAGNHVWSKAFGPLNQFYGTPGVAVAPDDSIWVAVPFQGAFQLDGKSYTSQGDHDVLALRFAPNGDLLAERQLGDVGNQLSWDVQTDLDGNAIVGGGFEGSMDGGDCAITQQGGYYDAFLIKLDKQGDPMWLHRFGDETDSGFEGLPDEVFFALAQGPGGSIVAGGQFDGTVDFGGVPLVEVSASGSNDIVIARYLP